MYGYYFLRKQRYRNLCFIATTYVKISAAMDVQTKKNINFA